MEQSPIMIVGHKNPDTDSICSAIAYADLKNQIDENTYIPKRAGKINNETAFVLNYFDMEVPDLLEDVNTQVKDIEYRETPGVNRNISVKAAWKMMRELDVVTLPIVTKNNHLEGLISINDIAKSYMDDFDSDVIAKANTSYGNLIDVLDGTLVAGKDTDKITCGRVMIGAANPHMIENVIQKDDIMIVGDRVDTQICGIEMGVQCLIICLNSPVNSLVLQLAKERDCSVITTPLDTYTVARLVNQSIPVQYFMKKENLVTFQLDDTVESIKEIMSKLRHRDFPIVDDFGHYYGMVSRRNLLALRKKKVILVDHNEKSQAIDGIEDAEICEIIDHHRLGSLQTISPVYFRNQPVGCTATIIYQMYQECGKQMDKKVAGLLCAAILSDTLLFRSPTCTPLDEMTARTLAGLADIELESFAMEMFEAGSSLKDKTAEELFNQDYKVFQVEQLGIGVSQISSVNQRELDKVASMMQQYVPTILSELPIQLSYIMLTNIHAQSSKLLAFGPDAINYVCEALGVEADGNVCILPGVVSRKKQVIPALVNTLQEII